MKKNRAHLLVLLVAMLLHGTIASAQESYNGKRTRGGAGYFMLGWNAPEFQQLSASLHAQGYPTFSNEALAFGGGGHYYLNRILLGGEGHAFKQEKGTLSRTSGDFETTLEAGYGLFTLGYLLVPHDRLQLYPLFGFGGGVTRLKIIEKNPPSFEDVLNAPGRIAELSNGGLLLNFGLGADTWLGIHRERRDYNGVVLGLRAGYLFTPVAGAWHLDEKKIRGGPKFDLSGPYARLVLGIGALAP